jgi:putative oxidoreductase
MVSFGLNKNLHKLVSHRKTVIGSFVKKRHRDSTAVPTESTGMAQCTAQQSLRDLRKPLPDLSSRLVSRFPIARWAPVPLRVIVGYGFMAHGFAKLTKGAAGFANILHGLQLPWPHFMAWSTIFIELFGGLAVILGLFVTLVSIPMAAVLLVALFTVHLPYGFSSIKLLAVTAAGTRFGPPGYETDLLYIACLATLIMGGSGPLAVDGLIGRRTTRL